MERKTGPALRPQVHSFQERSSAAVNLWERNVLSMALAMAALLSGRRAVHAAPGEPGNRFRNDCQEKALHRSVHQLLVSPDHGYSRLGVAMSLWRNHGLHGWQVHFRPVANRATFISLMRV